MEKILRKLTILMISIIVCVSAINFISIAATVEELKANNRARSSKLRVIQKVR